MVASPQGARLQPPPPPRSDGDHPVPDGSEALRFRILRGGYFAFLGTVVSVLGNFTVSVLLARFLEPEGLGVYTIYSILGIVLIPLLSFSIPSAVTKHVADLRVRDPRRLGRLLATALIFLAVAGALGSVLITLVVAPASGPAYNEPLLAPMVAIMGSVLLANMLALYSGAVLQGLEEFQTSNLVGGLGVLVNVSSLLVLTPSLGLVGTAAAAAFAVLVNAALAGWATIRALHRLHVPWAWRFSWPEARLLVGYVLPLNVAGLASRGSSLIQNSLVAIYLGFVDVGYLRIAGVFFSAVLFLPRMILSPMLPVLSSMTVSRTPRRQAEILTQLLRISILLLLPVIGGLLMALPFLIQVLYGTDFLPALPFAIITSIVGLFSFPTTLLGEQYFLATGRTRATLLATLYSVFVGLALVFLLLPRLGAISLPLSALAAESTLFALLLVWLVRRGEIHGLPMAKLAASLALVVLTSVATVFVAPPGIRLIAAGPYAAILAGVVFFVVMSRDERELIRSAIFRFPARRQGA